MGNMSYCRFQNTLTDLRDCYDNWESPDENQNRDEIKARQRLLETCKMIVSAFGGDFDQ